MTDKTPQQKAHEKYEKKRKGKPRFGGYITEKEKKKFTDTVNLGDFDSEKEMVLAAVNELYEKLSKK
ncbi:hypothetical protein J4N45_11105 [Vibrio sp. SCSIO 43140]|uniref:hypothetical protein n=1 Tax=Vibrio sp. SCSIO 43140 TaxID=2819100 RepID=UPI00207602D5|nr:hypothetical protein [Vibrio sp. SCSIO 43140]USD59079.1 hypothetical protein J4N45_11105 [Vibrio sp. SCSIO 43140]